MDMDFDYGMSHTVRVVNSEIKITFSVAMQLDLGFDCIK